MCCRDRVLQRRLLRSAIGEVQYPGCPYMYDSSNESSCAERRNRDIAANILRDLADGVTKVAHDMYA